MNWDEAKGWTEGDKSENLSGWDWNMRGNVPHSCAELIVIAQYLRASF